MTRFLMLTLLSAAPVPAQELQPRSTIVRATGNAAVSVLPSQARVRFSVVSDASTAERARERNAERATKVINELQGLLGQDAGIRTINYSSSKARSNGYIASNTIEVRIEDPSLAGKVVDIATKAGATVIGGIDTSVDEQDAQREALSKATLEAQKNAEAMAKALGLHVVRIVSAETAPTPVVAPRPVLSYGSEERRTQRSLPTPVAAGAIDIRAQVVVTLEVAP